MPDIGRRHFLKLGLKLAAVMGAGPSLVPGIAEALEQLASPSPPVVWLQALSCSGCSVSFLNSENPGPAEILTNLISLAFHSTLSTATGEVAGEVLHRSVEQGGFYLVVEGSIPRGMPGACRSGEQLVSEQIAAAARRARAVIAVGTCAAHGGVAAAEGNPTGAVSVPEYLKDMGISVPTISVPGCPVHPDWLLGTLVHALQFGIPPLDRFGRPKMFFSRLVHDQCPRFADYERERFATTFSDEGCLFKLGCMGPRTFADCSLRLWNAGTSYCIKAGAPCIGCAAEDFTLSKAVPLFTKKTSTNL